MQDLSALHLVFRIGGDLFAVPVRQVREVVAFTAPIPVPRAPDFVRGVVSHHGRIVTLIDLSRFLSVQVVSRDAPSHLIVLAREDVGLGIACDGVVRIDALAADPSDPVVFTDDGPVLRVDLDQALEEIEAYFG